MKLLTRLAVTYLTLLVIFTGLVISSFAIPYTAIEDNAKQSIPYVIDHGWVFPDFFQPHHFHAVDVFTDALMLNIAYYADSEHPVEAAMLDKFISTTDPKKGAMLLLETRHPSPEVSYEVNYSRYWHGNQVLLRLLLTVMSVRELRYVNSLLMLVLVSALTLLLWRRVSRGDALVVGGLVAVVIFPTVPFCMNFAFCFYIALLASCCILLIPSICNRWPAAVTCFFVIGAVTTYIDLLSTPMVTLGLPLAVYMLCAKPHRPERTLLLLALSWLTGYAILWMSKWLLAYLLLGYNMLSELVSVVQLRTVGTGEEGFQIMTVLGNIGIAFVSLLVIVSLLEMAFGRSRVLMRTNRWMLLLAFLQFVWMAVLVEHTWHHFWFTWRGLLVIALGVGLYCYHTLDFKHPLAFRKC